MLVITIGVAFITSVIALYLFNKQRRGIFLSKLEKAALLIGITVDILLIADIVIPNVPFLSAILGEVPSEAIWFVFGASSICFMLAIVFQVRRIRTTRALSSQVSTSTTDPRFAHLTIHYSQVRDAPDVQNPARPRYVTNNRTKQAYWVSDLLEPYVRQHKISWYSHDGEKTLLAYLDHEHYSANRRAPLPEELELSFDKDGSLKLLQVQMESDLMSKLKGRKLEDLQIVFLERRRFLSSPARRKLLLKFSTKQAFLPPSCTYELVDNGIVTFEGYGMYPWEGCKRWCKRHGYTLIRQHYPDSELTKGL